MARILETDLERFAEEFEPEKSEPEPNDTGEMDQLFAALEAMEKEHAARS